MRPATIIFEVPHGESKDGGGAPASLRAAESGARDSVRDGGQNIRDRLPVRSPNVKPPTPERIGGSKSYPHHLSSSLRKLFHRIADAETAEREFEITPDNVEAGEIMVGTDEDA